MKTQHGFLSMDWGKWMAVAGAVIFAGLAAYPLAQRSLAQTPGATPGKEEKKDKGGWAEKMMESKDKKPEMVEVKAAGSLAGRTFIGTKGGFFEIVGGKAQAVAGAPMGEVKTIVPFEGKLLVGTKQGLVVFDGSVFKAVDWDLSAAAKKHED